MGNNQHENASEVDSLDSDDSSQEHEIEGVLSTMLQKLSKCEVGASLCRNVMILPHSVEI